jgi:hypothetical protein
VSPPERGCVAGIPPLKPSPPPGPRSAPALFRLCLAPASARNPAPMLHRAALAAKKHPLVLRRLGDQPGQGERRRRVDRAPTTHARHVPEPDSVASDSGPGPRLPEVPRSRDALARRVALAARHARAQEPAPRARTRPHRPGPARPLCQPAAPELVGDPDAPGPTVPRQRSVYQQVFVPPGRVDGENQQEVDEAVA